MLATHRRTLDIDSFINDNSIMYEIRHYLTRSEKDLFMEWGG
jgi:hypothetical protein